VIGSGFVQIPTAELDALLAATAEDLARWDEHYAGLDVFALGPGTRLWDPRARLAFVAKRLSMFRSPARGG